MEWIETEKAVGHVLCHDITQIIPGVAKGPRFRKGHVVTLEDIPILLDLGKEHLYVWQMTPGLLHEDEGAVRLLALCRNDHMHATAPSEGKIELIADMDGLFQVDEKRLLALNLCGELLVATRRGNTAVKKGDKLAGMRVIPLVVPEAQVRAAEAAVGDAPLLTLRPWKRKRAGVVVTGGEIWKGRVQDGFSQVVEEKLAAFGVTVEQKVLCPDEPDRIADEIAGMREAGLELILCTGGMSVDPDDRTPAAIRQSGAQVVSYGAPVLPGAMLLLGYFPEGTPVLGLPGCVMYAKATVFDLLLPRILADVPLTREDMAAMGNGGLCLGCAVCRYPLCPFGR